MTAGGNSQTPVSEQSVIWWETGEHRPRMDKIRNINDVLQINLDVSEKGYATSQNSKDKSPAIDPKHLSLAISISRLPNDQREAIITLVKMGESIALGKNTKLAPRSKKQAKNT